MSDNVLLKALPPAVDYLAYLTILEYNLTSDQLPVLHDVLQDTTLTTNIGWDLVHLLLPLLPASKECLQDVARLGNPREVVLKTTELLESLGSEDDDEEDEDEDEDSEAEEEGDALGREDIGGSDTYARDTADARAPEQDLQDVHTYPEQDNKAGEPTLPATAPEHPDPTNTKDNPSAPLSSYSRYIQEFTTLIDMLSVLHPRIKTKYPSRFLATTLQAILRAYSRLARAPEATSAVLKFLRVMSGMYRPVLPPRQSTGSLSRLPAPDPEAQKEDVSAGETALQTRLLQSFLTHVLEDWMNSLRPVDDVPGMAWASRFSEMRGLDRAIPGRKLFNQRFEEEPELVSRTATINQINGLARHLKIDHEELLKIVTSPESDSPPTSPSSDLPSQASDVPLSPIGCLYLYCASAFSSITTTTTSLPPISTFPTHAHLLSKYLSPSAPTPTEPLLDTILFLGLSALFTNPTIPTIPTTDETTFHTHLRTLSLLAATSPSPTLRSHAHTLVSRLLHAHPSPRVRLALIRDTLQYCPYENLRACAVGWVKTEILAANAAASPVSKPIQKLRGVAGASTRTSRGADEDEKEDEEEDEDNEEAQNPFTTPIGMVVLAPHLFADPRGLWSHLPTPTPPTLTPPTTTTEKFTIWQPHTPFFLAVLNLWYLLCTSPILRERLDVRTGAGQWGLAGFVRGLTGGSETLRRGIDEGDEEAKAMLGLLEGTVEMVVEGMRGVGMEVGLVEEGMGERERG